MDLFSIWHWLILGLVVLLLFGGRGKLSDVMGDVAKGIKSFKKGLADNSEPPAQPETPTDAPDYHVSGAYPQRSKPDSKV
jgi:sec-independent protein translocase protein TatA